MAATAAPSARIACRPSLKMVIAISPNLSPGLPVRTARTSAERRLFRLAYRMPNRARKQLRARVCATRRAAVPSPATTMLRARPSDPMHAMPRGRADSADRIAPEPAPVPVTGDRRTCPGIATPGFAQTPRRLHHGKRPCERPRHRGCTPLFIDGLAPVKRIHTCRIGDACHPSGGSRTRESDPGAAWQRLAVPRRIPGRSAS